MHESGETLTEPSPASPELKPFSHFYFLVSATVVVGVVAYALVNISALPDPLPIHWNAAGEADNFAKRNLATVLMQFGFGPGFTLIVLWLFALTVHFFAKQKPSKFDQVTEMDVARRIESANLSLKYIGLWTLVLTTVLSFMMWSTYFLESHVEGSFWWELVAILIIIFALVGSLAHAQSRAQNKYPPEDSKKKLKWGIIYHNPEDHRLMVECQPGNYTINFAHKASWLIIGGLLLPSVLVTLLSVFFA